jgi:K+-sensing histidine kinase KdpD
MDSQRSRGMLERTVHDLRNPLAVVRASLEWLEIELTDRADALDAVHDATVAAARLLAIVDDLDLLAHLDTRPVIARDTVHVSNLVGRVSAALATRAHARVLPIVSTASPAIYTPGDDALLLRSIVALVDASARGAGADAVVEIDARVVAGNIEVEVGLRGTEKSGEPEGSIEALASSGLGIYVALRVAEAHGGSLVVVPTTTFPRVVMRLPVSISA